MITKKLIIHGRVQGVSYRAWMVQKAAQLNIWGWCRNLSDGTVEALVHGQENDIEEFVVASYDGPSLAVVDKIDITDADHDGSIGFEQRADS